MVQKYAKSKSNWSRTTVFGFIADKFHSRNFCRMEDRRMTVEKTMSERFMAAFSSMFADDVKSLFSKLTSSVSSVYCDIKHTKDKGQYISSEEPMRLMVSRLSLSILLHIE